MKIKIYDHLIRFEEAEIPDDFAFLRVTVMTGDEIIEVYRYDDEWGDPYLYDTLDPQCGNRTRDFFDASYIVRPEQMELWGERGNQDKWMYYWNIEGFIEKFKNRYVVKSIWEESLV